MASLLDTILQRKELKNASLNEAKSTASKQTPKARVVAFLNQKGGVGKTTMAFNTAHALAKEGLKVLAIDMDPQANMGLLFGVDLENAADEASEIPGPFHIHHLLINSVRELKALHVPTTLSDVLVRGEKVDLLPAGQELSGFELSVSSINFPRQLVLKRFLETYDLTNRYDAIVIDCPPTLGLLVVNVLCASSGVIVPFRPDEFSKKGLGHLYNMLDDIEDMGLVEVPQIIAHIPNLVDARRKQEGEDLEDIYRSLREEFGANHIAEPFYNRTQLVKGLAQHKSVFDYNSKEYESLQEQFLKIARLIKDWKNEKQSAQLYS